MDLDDDSDATVNYDGQGGGTPKNNDESVPVTAVVSAVAPSMPILSDIVADVPRNPMPDHPGHGDLLLLEQPAADAAGAPVSDVLMSTIEKFSSATVNLPAEQVDSFKNVIGLFGSLFQQVAPVIDQAVNAAVHKQVAPVTK